jgi:arylsulfatase A-like enzyme
VSYTHPHPPLVPLASYVDRYRGREIIPPAVGEWARSTESWPAALRAIAASWQHLPPEQHADMLRAFYALCTHIDHQIRILIGTLREEDILDNTVILFAGDHGDMLGTHGLYAKRVMYEGSCAVPMIVADTASSGRPVGRIDDRLVGLQDIMPTLLEACGLEIPETCEGLPMLGERRRDSIYCEALSGAKAMRMIHDGRHKLIWYPAGNVFQLFDIVSDPAECEDVSARPDQRDVLAHLQELLKGELYDSDAAFVRDGRLVGMHAAEIETRPNRGLSGQRGVHFPPTPPTDPTKVVGFG